MVFPRNVGFGRCYLVSTRHEILSNIDRNAKPNRNSAAAPKKPKWNKSRESTDPIPVLLLSLQSQTVVFQPFDFHQRKFKRFIIEKFYFPITRQHSTRHCRLKLRGQLGWNGSAPISTVLSKSVGFFTINIFLKVKKLPKLKSGKWWTRLAWYPLQYGNWWNNPSSEENGTGQYPETQETGL